MSIESLCNSIVKPSFIFNPSIKVAKWRDENPEVIRKVATGAVLAGSALLSIIDTVASLALAILSSPLRLGGIKFADAFLTRVIINCFLGGFYLTVGQYDNVTADKVSDTWNSHF